MIDAYLGDAPVYLDPGTSADPAEGSRLSGIFLDGSGCAEAYVGDDLIFAEPGAGNHELVIELNEPGQDIYFYVNDDSKGNGQRIEAHVDGTVFRTFVPRLTSTWEMFEPLYRKIKRLVKIPDMSAVTEAYHMFHLCKFEELDLSGWDVRNLKYPMGLFYSTTIGTLDISGWNLASWSWLDRGSYTNEIFQVIDDVDEIRVEGTDFNNQHLHINNINRPDLSAGGSSRRKYARFTGRCRNVGSLAFTYSCVTRESVVMLFEALTAPSDGGGKLVDIYGLYSDSPLTDEDIAIATSKGYTVTKERG